MSDSEDLLPSDTEQEIHPSGRRPSVGHSDDESTVSTTISEPSENGKKTQMSKRDPTKPAKRMRKARAKIIPLVGQFYRLRDGREGECRFFGETKFADGEWAGLVLNPEFEGKNDGSVKGKRYFKCQDGRGVFVKQKQLECEIKTKSKNKRVSEIGMNKGYKMPKFKSMSALKKPQEPEAPRIRSLGPRDYGVNAEYEMPKFKEKEKKVEEEIERVRSLGPRDYKADDNFIPAKYKKKEKAAPPPKVKRQRSLGPREMGRNVNYVMPKFKKSRPKERELEKKRERAQGPRDIGKSDDYVPPKFKKRKPKEPKPTLKRERSLGPRDFGRDDEYVMPKFKKKTPKPQEPMPKKRALGPRDFQRDDEYVMPKFKKRTHKEPEPKTKKTRALGPRDIPRNDDYVMPKFKDSKKKKKEEQPAKVSKKPGPRDVGKNSEYKMPKFRDNKRRNSSSGRKSGDEYTMPKFKKKLPKAQSEPIVQKQLGPRDIGRNKYKRAKYDIDEPWKIQPKEAPLPVEKKQGPREAGRMKYDAAKYEIKDDGSFLGERVAKINYTERADKKAGPREIGKNKDWKAVDYGIDLKKLAQEDFTKERTSTSSKIEDVKVEKKLGPREIGRMKYKAAKFKIKDDGDFLGERLSGSRSLQASKSEPVVKKLGPRDIGRMKYKAAKFEIKDDGDFLSERVASTTKAEAPKKKVKKAGPRDIADIAGRNKSYDAAKFEIKEDGDFLGERVAKASTEKAPKKERVTSGKKSKSSSNLKKEKEKEEAKEKTGPKAFKKPKFTRKLKKKDEDDEMPPMMPAKKRAPSKGDPAKDSSQDSNPWGNVLKKKPEFSKIYFSNKGINEILHEETKLKTAGGAENAVEIKAEEAKEEEEQKVAEPVEIAAVKDEPKVAEEEVVASAEEILSAFHNMEEVVDAAEEVTSADPPQESKQVEDDEETESEEDVLADLDEEEHKDEPVAQEQEAEEEEKPTVIPDRVFSRGLYTVKKATWLREEIDTNSKKLRKVNAGEFVNITDVVENEEGTRVRGRVNTDGYMTLKNLENDNEFVKLIRKTQDAEDEDSSVEITESEDEDVAERPAIMADWENDHVLSWIETMPSLRKYAEDFEIGEVDGDDLILYNDEDLKALGIDSSVHRKLLLSAVKKYLES